MFHVMFLIVKKSAAAMTIYNLRFLGRFYVEYANREHLSTAPTSILSTTHAAQTVTLGEPIFVEKGKSTVQKEIGPNRTLFSFASNGTVNDTIEVTNTGEYEVSPRVTIWYMIKGTE